MSDLHAGLMTSETSLAGRDCNSSMMLHVDVSEKSLFIIKRQLARFQISLTGIETSPVTMLGMSVTGLEKLRRFHMSPHRRER